MFEIIPAIDLIGGNCVRLTQGTFESKKIYPENPLEAAKRFEDAGLFRLHLVDLDGAKNGRVMNLKILERIAAETNLKIDYGGGIKTDGDIESVFAAGAAMVSVGSSAVREPERFFEWLTRFGGDKLLLGADVRGENIAIDGWQSETHLNVFEFLENYYARGISQIFCTDIARDGLLSGAATDLYRRILSRLPDLKLIASGGVASLENIRELESIGCSGAIVGKAFFEGKIKLKEIYAG